jgi:hypothetical protein
VRTSVISRTAVGLVGALLLVRAFSVVGQTPVFAEKSIKDLAAKSNCASYSWKDRGRAPLGYIKGIALVYAKSYCEVAQAKETAVSAMKAPFQDRSIDALALYGRKDSTDKDRLRAVYTLGIGLGMRESSGNTTEGRDVLVTAPTADNAEAGLFQTSYDSFSRSPWLAKLYDQYKAAPLSCRLDVFEEGIKEKKAPVVGSGPGAEYQSFTKACPAFATEYAMVMLRVDRKHFGTINTRKAEFVQVCYDFLRQVEAIVKQTCTP